MSEAFGNLLSPLRIRGRTVPNRIVFGPHRTNFAVNNRFGLRHVAYYRTRAQGGCGIIILEGSVVHPSDRRYEYVPIGYEEDAIEGYRQIADAVHGLGGLVLAQLTHSGGQGSSHYTQMPLWAPSATQEVNSRESAKAMELEDISATIAGFTRSAAIALRGELDGVEIDAGRYSLVRQFLSPMTNQRQDEYGGSFENRLHFVREIIRAVRTEVGDQAILGLRLSCDEYAPWAGIKPEDAASIAEALSRDALVDYISATSGGIYSTHMTRAGLFRRPGYATHLAAKIKEVTTLPVFAQGSIVEPPLAEGLIKEGRASMVEMTRALIADPELPKKLHEGIADEIRPCILCNQGCVVETVQNPPLSCTVNPCAGHENDDEFAELSPAPIPRRITVVGGGPSGLEASRVAALRGHHVTLVERRSFLGGAARVSSATQSQSRRALAVDWLEAQITRLGVSVRLGNEATIDHLLEESPDAVIIATGGHPPEPPPTLRASIPILNPREVLEGKVQRTPGRAAIVDCLGNRVAVSVAEWLAEHAWHVTVLTQDLFVGQQLAATLELTPWYEKAYREGIEFCPESTVESIEDHDVVVRGRFSGAESHVEKVDLLVYVAHELPEERLYLQLKEAGLQVVRVGDCVAPRGLGQAILEGYRAGRLIA